MALIAAFGRYLPDRVVTNGEIGGCLNCSPEWIAEVSGIDERRYAAPNETVVDMAVAAGRDCLRASGIQPSEIRSVFVASGTAARRFPGPAAEVASALKIVGPVAIDLPIAGAGALFAIAFASVLASRSGPSLVIASERMSTVAFGDPLEKGTAVLFGGGAGACLVDPAAGAIRIVDWVLHSDGSFADDLHLEFSGGVAMNARSVIMEASRKVPAAIREVFERNRLKPDAARVFIMHPANPILIERVARTLGIDPACFISNNRPYGNTSSASMLIAAAEYWKAARPAPGSYLCLAGLGAGFHWGALIGQTTASSAESRA
jgi:3-oxoacyl-[acyl-carrier-protein] synthase-3